MARSYSLRSYSNRKSVLAQSDDWLGSWLFNIFMAAF